MVNGKTLTVNLIRSNVLALVLLAGFVILPLIFKDASFHNMIIYILIYAIVGEGWNLISGFTGQTSFGHAAYFGIGAYTVAVMGNTFNVTPWIGMFAGAFIATSVAFAVNYKLFNLKGHYFAIATLAVCEILRTVFSKWKFVGAGDGVKILFRPENKIMWLALDVQNRLPFLFITLSVLIIVFIVCRWLETSKMGHYWKCIRESHEVAQSIGITPQKYKVIAMMVSAFIAAIGGAFYVQFFKYIDSSVFGLHVSMIFVLVTVLGGIGNVYGPVIGSIIYYGLELFMRQQFGGRSSGINLVIFGALIVIVVCYQPRGIMGIYEDLKHKIQKQTAHRSSSGVPAA